MLVHSNAGWHTGTRRLRLSVGLLAVRLLCVAGAAGALAACSREAIDGPRWNLGALRASADEAATPSPARGRLAENRVVVVKNGDSLAAIAQRNGVSIMALMEANQLQDTTIVPGQILMLPIH